MKYILFFSLLFSGYAHADCNGVNFNFSKTSFEKIPLKLKQDGGEKTFELGDMTFRYNGQCWEFPNEVDNPDPDEENSKPSETTYSCRDQIINDIADIETHGSKLLIYGLDSNGKKIPRTYLELKANTVAPGPNYSNEYPVEVTAFDGAAVGNLKVHIPVKKEDSNDTATRDIRKNSMITDGCNVTKENEHGKKEISPEKDMFCGWSDSKKESYDCNNKEYTIVRKALNCDDKTTQPLFCEKTKNSTGTDCFNDNQKSTLDCMDKWQVETAMKEKEKCKNWGDDYIFDCDGTKYYHGSPLCDETGFHKAIFCSEAKSKNGFICEIDNSAENSKCLKMYYEKEAKAKKEEEKQKASPTKEKKEKFPEGTNV